MVWVVRSIAFGGKRGVVTENYGVDKLSVVTPPEELRPPQAQPAPAPAPAPPDHAEP